MHKKYTMELQQTWIASDKGVLVQIYKGHYMYLRKIQCVYEWVVSLKWNSISFSILAVLV